MHSSGRGSDGAGHSDETPRDQLPDVGIKCSRDKKSCILDTSAHSTSQVHRKLSRPCSHQLLSSLKEHSAENTYPKEPMRDNLQCDLKNKSPRPFCSKHQMNKVQYPTQSMGLKKMQEMLNSKHVAASASDHEMNQISRRITLDDSQIAYMFDGSIINPIIDLPEILSNRTERPFKSGPRAMQVMPDGTIQNMFSSDVDVDTILDNMESIANKKQMKTKRLYNNLGQMKTQKIRCVKPSEYIHKLRSMSNRSPKLSPYRILQKLQQNYKPLQDAETQTLPTDVDLVEQKDCAVQTPKALLLTRGCQKSLVPIDSKHKSTNTLPIPQKETVSISCQATIEQPSQQLDINKYNTNESQSSYKALEKSKLKTLINERKNLQTKPKSVNICTQTEISHPLCETTSIELCETDKTSDTASDMAPDMASDMAPDIASDMAPDISPNKKFLDTLKFIADDEQQIEDTIASSFYKGKFNLYIIIIFIFLIWCLIYLFGSFTMNIYIKHLVEQLQEWYFQATENPVTKFELIFAYMWKFIS